MASIIPDQHVLLIGICFVGVPSSYSSALRRQPPGKGLFSP